MAVSSGLLDLIEERLNRCQERLADVRHVRQSAPDPREETVALIDLGLAEFGLRLAVHDALRRRPQDGPGDDEPPLVG